MTFGDRVGVFTNRQGDCTLIGYGILDEERFASKEDMYKNKHTLTFKLDDGTVVSGKDLWWADEESIQALVKSGRIHE